MVAIIEESCKAIDSKKTIQKTRTIYITINNIINKLNIFLAIFDYKTTKYVLKSYRYQLEGLKLL